MAKHWNGVQRDCEISVLVDIQNLTAYRPEQPNRTSRLSLLWGQGGNLDQETARHLFRTKLFGEFSYGDKSIAQLIYYSEERASEQKSIFTLEISGLFFCCYYFPLSEGWRCGATAFSCLKKTQQKTCQHCKQKHKPALVGISALA